MSRSGDTLVINGETFDFAFVSDMATLPLDAIQSPWFASAVERIDGVLHVALIVPHGTHAPKETLYPDAVWLDTDGPVTLPPYSTEVEPENDQY